MNRFVLGGQRMASGISAMAPPGFASAAALRSTLDTLALAAKYTTGETAIGSWNERRTTFVTSCNVLVEDIRRLHDNGITFSRDPVKLRMITENLRVSDSFATSAVGIGELFTLVSHGIGMTRIIFGESFELGEGILSFCAEHGLTPPRIQNPQNLSEATKAFIQLRREERTSEEESERLFSLARSDIFSEANALFREALGVANNGSGELQPLVHSLSTRSGRGTADVCITLAVVAAFCADSESRLSATEHLLSLGKTTDSGISLTAHVLLMDLQKYSDYGDVRRQLNDAGFRMEYFEGLFTKEYPRQGLNPTVREIHGHLKGFATRTVGGERKIVDGKARLVGGTSKIVSIEHGEAFGKFD